MTSPNLPDQIRAREPWFEIVSVPVQDRLLSSSPSRSRRTTGNECSLWGLHPPHNRASSPEARICCSGPRKWFRPGMFIWGTYDYRSRGSFFSGNLPTYPFLHPIVSKFLHCAWCSLDVFWNKANSAKYTDFRQVSWIPASPAKFHEILDEREQMLAKYHRKVAKS